MLQSSNFRANLDRFLVTMEASAQIGIGRENGLRRLALSESDRDMRDLFVKWCKESHLTVSIDGIGNIFARREGSENLPPVLIGSHLDTQENGGRFDGIVGVLAGLEVLRRLDDLNITTRRPIEVVDWTNEEGARFSPPMVASGCFVGDHDLEWALNIRDDEGTTIRDALSTIGYRGTTPVGNREIDAYFELHIEQGDELDSNDREVGVVTHGYKSHGVLVEYKGETAHTGPWPMERRRNALAAGARLLTAVDDIGWEYAATQGKATAARLVASPNKPGILSDWAEAVCDVRHNDPAIADEMRMKMMNAINDAAKRTSCHAKVLNTWSWGGDIFDKEMVATVREAVRNLGYKSWDLPSQAGHDAYFLARHFPTAMIFTPCKDGITHNNNELATTAMMEPGLNVLLHAVLARADRP